MKKLLELIEKPEISRHLPTALWITSPNNRGEGRSTCLSIAFALNAIRNPGMRLSYFDHHDQDAKDTVRQIVQSICDHVIIDRRTLVCNKSIKTLPNIPKHQVKEMVIDLVRSAVKLAKENGIDTEELIDVVRQEMILSIMEY